MAEQQEGSHCKRSESAEDDESDEDCEELPTPTRGISRRSTGQIFANQFKAQLSIDREHQVHRHRLLAARILNSGRFEVIIGLVTLANFGMILVDTDFAAEGKESPWYLKVGNIIVLVIFGIELSMRVYVRRRKVISDNWNLLDMLVVAAGILELVMDAAESDDFIIGPLRTLRCLRLLRIVKAFVLMDNLKELRRMVQGIAACFRVLVWSLLMVFIFMTMWAAVAVELLNPLMQEVAEQSYAPWSGCSRCERAFSSVMTANLTLFQTITAGDSWGLIAIPVIEMHPWAAIIFVGSLFTVNIGILNLVVAVLVDAAQDARESDTAAKFREAQQDERVERRNLEKIFRQVDADGSGSLSLEELVHGAETVEDFQKKLRVMDIQGQDLHQLFHMLDADESGEIDPDEFIETLYRMKCGDNKTAATFVKHYIVHLKEKQTELSRLLCAMHDQIADIRHSITSDRMSHVQADGPTRAKSVTYDQMRAKSVKSITSSVGPTRAKSAPTVGASADASPRSIREGLKETSPRSNRDVNEGRRLSTAPGALELVDASEIVRNATEMLEDMRRLSSFSAMTCVTKDMSPRYIITDADSACAGSNYGSDVGKGALDALSNFSRDLSNGVSDAERESVQKTPAWLQMNPKAWDQPQMSVENDKADKPVSSSTQNIKLIPRSTRAHPRLSDPIREIDALMRRAIEQTAPAHSKGNNYTSPRDGLGRDAAALAHRAVPAV